MALTTVDYNSYFNYKLATKQLTLTDKSDFVDQGTVAANVTVVAKITAPITGVFYNNTNHSLPDIDCGTSLNSIIEIALPLDAGGIPEQGEYTIELTYVDSVVPATIVDTRTFTLNYTAPTVDLTMEVDCNKPLLTSTDSTGYTQNTIDPTITRAMQINYPLSLNVASVTGTANVITTRNIYTVANQTVEHSSSLVANLSYLFDVANSMYVIDEISGSSFIEVACDGDMCDIYCCIRSQYLRWQDSKGTNTQLSNIELGKYVQIMSIAGMIDTASRCSKSSDISEYVAEILKIADCDSGCGCADGEPQLVTGLGVNGDEVIVAQGTGMTVTSTSGGGTTTYTVNLSATNVTKLANMTNSVVAPGTGASVSSSSAIVGGIQTYTYVVSATDTVVESLFARVKFTFNTSTVPTISITNQNNYGSSLIAVNQAGTGTDFITNNNVSTFLDWTGSYTDFDIANFGTPSTTYFPEVLIVNGVHVTKGASTTWQNDLKMDIVEMSSNTFAIRFSDSLGNPINGLYLQNKYSELELIFKIQA